MRWYALFAVSALAVLSAVLILADVAHAGARDFLRRRSRRRNGTYGVVLDGRGNELGIYLDPFAQHLQGARVHTGDSPWTTPGPDPWSGWAWEGFGETIEEARAEANRLRRRYLQLLPWLDGAEEAADFWE
ncbi:MAG TPA: hypothetical protein VGV85_00515 [Longimicrobiaceae bacterium]|nr:hypothetical protein [Longimicrobiaceae bacterium]